MLNTVLNHLLHVRSEKGAGYLALLEPDKLSGAALIDMAVCCEANGVDALLIGSSLMLTVDLDEAVSQVKAHVDIPIILFPGALHHISRHADAILFLSLISGRNPQYLIGEQVHAAPIIQAYDLEPIATGYILIGSDSGGIRSPKVAQEKVQAGAGFVVTGTILEEQASPSLIREFADAIHKNLG